MWRSFDLGMCRYVKIFLEITIGGPCKHFGGQIWAATALLGAKTVTMKLTKKAAMNLTTLQGRRHWGASGVRPHFMFGPRLLHTSNIVFEKMWPHLVVFGPSCCEILAKGLPHSHYIFIEYLTGLVQSENHSGVLFHTLYVTITDSQRQKKRMLIVIHLKASRSFF